MAEASHPRCGYCGSPTADGHVHMCDPRLLREQIERLRAAAVAAKALAIDCEDRGYRCEVPEHRLVALESALEAAGYGMTDDEGVESESP